MGGTLPISVVHVQCYLYPGPSYLLPCTKGAYLIITTMRYVYTRTAESYRARAPILCCPGYPPPAVHCPIISSSRCDVQLYSLILVSICIQQTNKSLLYISAANVIHETIPLPWFYPCVLSMNWISVVYIYNVCQRWFGICSIVLGILLEFMRGYSQYPPTCCLWMELMLLTLMVAKSNMYVYAPFGNSGSLGDDIHEWLQLSNPSHPVGVAWPVVCGISLLLCNSRFTILIFIWHLSSL